MRKPIFFIWIIILISHVINAQQSSEPLWDQLQQKVKNESFNIGFLVQSVFDYQGDRLSAGENGFSIANARVKFYGKLDKKFSYYLQANFISSPSMLDAYITFRKKESLGFRIGYFKTPFSAEYLISAANIDFVNRSTVVNYLAPKRQAGFMVFGEAMKKQLNYYISMTNGSRDNGNDNGNFMYTSRVTFSPADFNGETQSLQLGINLALSKDSERTFDRLGIQNFVSGGNRTLFGADFRFFMKNLLLAMEYIYATLNPDIGETIHPQGFYVTGGYHLRKDMQVLIRMDHFDRNIPQVNDATEDYFVFGFNYWTTSAVEIQANYIIDTDNSALKHHQLLFNFQIAF